MASMLTVGVDLAADPARTAACTIDWSVQPPAARSYAERATDERLVMLAQKADKVGIDCPFGWPEPFVEAVSAHALGHAWPGRESPPADFRHRLSYRATDLAVKETIGVMPLSVAADRIGVTTMRLAALLDQLAQDGHVVDRSGAGVVAEVYPAATLKSWSLPHQRYKRGPSAREVRSSLVDQLLSEFSLEVEPDDETRLRRSHDVLDALIAALVARAAALGLTTSPEPGEQQQRACAEGWIHLPSAPLSALSSD